MLLTLRWVGTDIKGEIAAFLNVKHIGARKKMNQEVPKNFELWRLELVRRDSCLSLLLISSLLIVAFSMYQHWVSCFECIAR